MVKEGYLKKEERKNILLLCDDIRMHSGIATMAKEFVVGSAHKYNWYNLGAGINHPEAGKILDLSVDVNKQAGIEDSSVFLQPNNGYGNAAIIRKLLANNNFDAIFIFTDPRYWEWLFEIEREIRSKIPIIWLNIWDEYPAPMYNRNFYNSVDCLMGISKQTVNINKLVLGDDVNGKVIDYVPHGINSDTFFPISESHYLNDQLQDFKKNTIPIDNPEFIVYFNSRNIHRKHPGDSILAYKLFCDKIGREKASKCAFILHTAAVDPHGTDLRAVKEAIAPEENIYFSTGKITPQQMNMMYNLADVTMLLSSNEGWGLALTESMMAGTMIIANVTGGMQDQMRFVNDKGEWIDFDSDFPSNHRGTYKEHGEWAMPVFPSNISLQGSPKTPYIFDDRCSPEDAADALLKIYEMNSEERKANGLKGHKWAISDESGMSAKVMCENIIRNIDKTLEEFKPRPYYEVIKVENIPSKQIPHKLTGY